MEVLSEELVRRLARSLPGRPARDSPPRPARSSLCDDVDGIFAALGRVLSEIRGRRVVLRQETFPPHTASGLWLDLHDMDIVVVRKDAADTNHALVIAGHEIWHMVSGHCSARTSAGPTAARGHALSADAIESVVKLLLASADDRMSDAGQLKYAARTDFTQQHEAEAELFGLKFATDLRELRRHHQRPDLDELAGRIADSLGRGPWA
jgi:hypothetical protein